MKTWSSCLGIFLLFAILLAGCERGELTIEHEDDISSTRNEQVEGESNSNKEEAFPIETGNDMKGADELETEPDEIENDMENPANEEGVVIQLDDDPRIKAPIVTILSPEVKQYSIVFNEELDRSTVEEAIQRNISQSQEVEVSTEFDWRSGQELQLKVQVSIVDPNIESLITEYPVNAYTINVNGSSTGDKRTLENQHTLRDLVQNPTQIWRISTDGKTIEKVRQFEEPYQLQLLNNTRFALATQTTGYCECDAPSRKIYTLYDFQEDHLTRYPVELEVKYKGPGDFVADTRGFFYSQKEDAAADIPSSDTVFSISLDGYVHGAEFSKDRRYVLMAVGPEDQVDDLDFYVYELETEETLRFPKGLIGRVPQSQVSSAFMPVHFNDDGAGVYVHMHKEGMYEDFKYVFKWENKSLEAWEDAPEKLYEPSHFKSSYDGQYRIYPNLILYKDGESVSENVPVPGYNSHWFHTSNDFVTIHYEGNNNEPATSHGLALYNADSGKNDVIVSNLSRFSLLGVEEGDEWIYVEARDLK